MTNEEAYRVVCHPLPTIKSPRRAMSLRVALILAGIAVAIGTLIAFAEIYEVMT